MTERNHPRRHGRSACGQSRRRSPSDSSRAAHVRFRSSVQRQRPTATEAEKAPALPQGVVELSEEAQKNGGVQVATVAVTTLPTELQVTGIVAPEESRVAHIRPLARGVIEEIFVSLGARVSKGPNPGRVRQHRNGSARRGVSEREGVTAAGRGRPRRPAARARARGGVHQTGGRRPADAGTAARGVQERRGGCHEPARGCDAHRGAVAPVWTERLPIWPV